MRSIGEDGAIGAMGQSAGCDGAINRIANICDGLIGTVVTQLAIGTNIAIAINIRRFIYIKLYNKVS